MRRKAFAGDVGAIVLGGDYQGLGIVRSLGRHGIPVCVGDDERSISRFSRYSSHFIQLPDLADADDLAEALLDSERALGLGGWVVFATRDETVAALSRHRDRLSERLRVPVPAWETFRHAWDKRSTYELARRLDIPVPRTWYPTSLDELEAIDAAPPLVVKPAVKPRFFKATKAKAWAVETVEELRERFGAAQRAAGGDPIMVQELLPGTGERQYAYCAFFKSGRAAASMTVRRLRQHPHDFGRASTYVETVEVPEIETLGERFLREIDYYGLAELEFKLHEGRYKLLDFNARTWGYHSIGVEAGVDFPYLLFCDQLGATYEGRRARAGVRWMRLLTDLPTALVDIRAGRLDALAYLRSLRDRDVEAVFSLEDPRPGLAEVALLPYLYLKRGF